MTIKYRRGDEPVYGVQGHAFVTVLICPGCGVDNYIAPDQFAGQRSIVCGACGHETHENLEANGQRVPHPSQVEEFADAAEAKSVEAAEVAPVTYSADELGAEIQKAAEAPAPVVPDYTPPPIPRLRRGK